MKVIDRIAGEIIEGIGAIDEMQRRVLEDYENAEIIKSEDKFEIVQKR
ncbi:MAG: hypothetical protein ACI4PE_03410 [Bacilli bacterium]